MELHTALEIKKQINFHWHEYRKWRRCLRKWKSQKPKYFTIAEAQEDMEYHRTRVRFYISFYREQYGYQKRLNLL